MVRRTPRGLRIDLGLNNGKVCKDFKYCRQYTKAWKDLLMYHGAISRASNTSCKCQVASLYGDPWALPIRVILTVTSKPLSNTEAADLAKSMAPGGEFYDWYVTVGTMTYFTDWLNEGVPEAWRPWDLGYMYRQGFRSPCVEGVSRCMPRLWNPAAQVAKGQKIPTPS
jgi:hypothetical protein